MMKYCVKECSREQYSDQGSSDSERFFDTIDDVVGRFWELALYLEGIYCSHKVLAEIESLSYSNESILSSSPLK